jgi:hypothetical protein
MRRVVRELAYEQTRERMQGDVAARLKGPAGSCWEVGNWYAVHARFWDCASFACALRG